MELFKGRVHYTASGYFPMMQSSVTDKGRARLRGDDMVELSKEQLKDVAKSIVVGQGNQFVKELLRDNQIPIGLNKSDFYKNMMDAIDGGRLTEVMLVAWLEEVEGWGNQHIHLHEPLARSLDEVRQLVAASDYADLLNATAVTEFPDFLELTSIAISEAAFTLSWHKGNSSWTRVKRKDYRDEQEGDVYEFRAFRERSNRTVVRYEWVVGKPYSAVFIQLPNEGTLHADATNEVWRVLVELGLIEVPLPRVPLTKSVHGFRQDAAQVTATSAKLHAEGGYAEFVTTLPEGGIDQVEALRKLDRAVEDDDFPRADGKFKLSDEVHDGLSRPLTVEVIGGDSRIRLWVQCKREDVYLLTDLLWEHGLA